jgi:predicted ATP-binding protein involved in virulence
LPARSSVNRVTEEGKPDVPEYPAVSRLEVTGLFGYLRHEIDFRVDDPTILTGLNGSGKTHVLHVLRALTQGDALSAGEIPFRSAFLSYSMGARTSCERVVTGEAVTIVMQHVSAAGKTTSVTVPMPTEDEIRSALPPWIRRLGDRYVNERTGELVPPTQLRSLTRHSSGLLASEDEDDLRAFRGSLPPMAAFVIDTRRLDTVINEDDPHWRTRGVAASKGAASRIELYLDRIKSQVNRARANAVKSSQQADISFAERALASASKTVYENQLRARYNAVVDQYNDLARSGLTVGDAPIPFPSNTTPTVRRILDPFVEDWEKRLAPLRPLNEKIKLFRALLDDKFDSSFKKTVAHSGGISIADIHGRQLNVNKLSSGEQHLLALYTRLLFDTRRGSLVLIDEPEISLHPAWQHAFVRDIDRVQDLVPMQVVIATHSPSIVNERWELEEALEITEPPRLEPSEDPHTQKVGLGQEDDTDE